MTEENMFMLRQLSLIVLGSLGVIICHQGIIHPIEKFGIFLVVVGAIFTVLGFVMFGISLEMANPTKRKQGGKNYDKKNI